MQSILTPSTAEFVQRLFLKALFTRYNDCIKSVSSIFETHGNVSQKIEEPLQVLFCEDTHKDITARDNISIFDESSCDSMSCSSELENNMEKLNRIAAYEKNWNGNDALPLPRNIIEKVKSLLPELYMQPQLFPTACDSIQIEYEKENGEYLEFQIFEDSISFFRIDVLGKETEGKIDGSKDEINKAVKEFYGIIEYRV